MNTWDIQLKIHEAVKTNFKTDMTELELAKIIGSVAPDFQGDIVSGVRSGGIEGGPTDKKILRGEPVILDLQVFLNGQWSDITRTYFAGCVSSELECLYKKVESAIYEGEKLLKSGVRVSDIYNVTNQAVNSPYAFTHHAGHLTGDEPLLQPQFLPDRDEVLHSGDIVTLEPGAYIPEKCGIRLENNYRINEGGFESLFNMPLDISGYILEEL